MSDMVPPVSPITFIQPSAPIAGLRDTDTRLYQIFASSIIALFKSSPSTDQKPRLAMELHTISTVDLRVLSIGNQWNQEKKSHILDRRKVEKKNKKAVSKIENLFQGKHP